MKTYDDSSLDATNPAARVPIAVLLDVSSSMLGTPIAELNRGINRFFTEVRNDDAAAMSADIAIVTFNSTAQVAHGFASAFDYPNVLAPFEADGQTATGPALELAEHLLAAREAEYCKVGGIPHYKPWCICLTDGRPFPDRGWRGPAQRFREKAARGDLTYLMVGVGDRINEKTLVELSAEEPGVQRLQDLKFSDFFIWLSQSMHDISVAGTANQDDVRLRGMSAWARFAKPGGTK
jgi:uncharacterized protein YegL